MIKFLAFLPALLLFQSGLDWDDCERMALKNPQRAFELLTERIESERGEDDLERARIQSLRGKLLLDFGLYQEASVTLYEAEEVFAQEDCAPCLAKNHNYLGELYYKIKGVQAALDRHFQALAVFEKVGDREELAKTQGFIGTMYEKLEDYPEAIRYQKLALATLKDSPQSLAGAFVLENLGSIYEDLERYDSSSMYFSKALALNLELGDSTHLPGNLNNLADIERKTGNYELAMQLSEKAKAASEALGNLYQQKSALVDISKTFSLMGNYDLAYQRLEEARRLDEEIFSAETARQLSIQETQYRLQQQIAQIRQLEQESDFEDKFRALLVFLLLLLVGIGLLIFNRQKLKIRSGKALLEQQEKMLQIKERLIATEKENINLLEARMSVEVESQSKALTAQTVHLLEKNQMLEGIRQKLKNSLDVEPKDQKKRIRHLIKQIDYNFSQDADWEDFKNNFEKVHQDFFKSISKDRLELTPAEMKLASLIRMNLSSKEIAATLGISPESLRIARYRLRKKLGLQKGESLQNYILCI
ncbi:tetratricopeptide repeat protein [Algoriphagus sp. H41]|uniref:Tetratricopeptide repeat protein n=1 Tax=Algoriphagus oliviformis TaxID=2811231 RepID=A0ABS3C5C6_9BACT|nr:tetratricopeptide repeat protein [Algoriphagus oliviformis]MBN7812193.1 tetratricopeptide repeat protein [Algoriphagus oliviformis]